MTIAEFDHLDNTKKTALLQQCCGSSNWVNKMIDALPVEDLIDLIETAEDQWFTCSKEDWVEAFAHHPKIGDLQSVDNKWAKAEQAGVQEASEETLRELAEANKQYQEKFGYIFIICARGKPAGDMLVELKTRLQNNADVELDIAMEEQLKITKIRLEKLFNE